MISNALPIKNYWNEVWKRIEFPEFENEIHYEISNYGRIKSFQNSPDGKLITGSKIQGYFSLNIKYKQKSVNKYVHKLVAEYFVKKQNTEDQFVLHIDHDKLNNNYENLRWGSRTEVTNHNKHNPSVINKIIPKRTKNYKLTESKVIMIKKLLLSEKNRFKMIAKQFGITHTQLNRIRSGENWKHVKLEEEKTH
ncbi:NUMOD4 domain-containing protein [Aquirufa sp. ROCK2-A2]